MGPEEAVVLIQQPFALRTQFFQFLPTNFLLIELLIWQVEAAAIMRMQPALGLKCQGLERTCILMFYSIDSANLLNEEDFHLFLHPDAQT